MAPITNIGAFETLGLRFRFINETQKKLLLVTLLIEQQSIRF